MGEKIFRLLSREELEQVYRVHMTRDFPPEERKPLSRIQALTERGFYKPYGLFDEGGELLAYAFYCGTGEDDPYVMLDYLAVTEGRRNQGTGSAFLREMLDRSCADGRGVFGEAECPDTGDEETDALRRRRLGFYDRCGLRRAGFTERAFGVHYVVLLYGPDISDEDLMDISRRIYRVMVPDEAVYRANIVIPAEEADT